MRPRRLPCQFRLDVNVILASIQDPGKEEDSPEAFTWADPPSVSLESGTFWKSIWRISSIASGNLVSIVRNEVWSEMPKIHSHLNVTEANCFSPTLQAFSKFLARILELAHRFCSKDSCEVDQKEMIKSINQSTYFDDLRWQFKGRVNVVECHLFAVGRICRVQWNLSKWGTLRRRNFGGPDRLERFRWKRGPFREVQLLLIWPKIAWVDRLDSCGPLREGQLLLMNQKFIEWTGPDQLEGCPT